MEKAKTKDRRSDSDAGDQIIVDYSRGGWGAVPECILEDRRISLSARCIAAWIITRPRGWVVRRWHLLEVLGIGLDAWWAARRQLIDAGYLVTSQSRPTRGRFNACTYRLDPYAGVDAANAEVAIEPIATAQGFSVHGEAEHGRTEHGGPRRLPTPVLPTPVSTTPPPTRAAEQALVRGGGGAIEGEGSPGAFGEKERPQGSLAAVAPTGANAPKLIGVGTRLADLLTPSEMGRADAAGIGASEEQLRRAERVVRGMIEQGTVRTVPALAVRMARMAARGEVSAPVSKQAATTPEEAPPWRSREARVGWWVEHPKGILVVEPGSRAWRHRGGERNGQLVAGAGALSVWRRVEAGELMLNPPDAI